MPSFPCAATRDLARYEQHLDNYDAREVAIERAVDHFVNLSVQDFWARLPDNGPGSLSDRMADLLNEYAAGLVEDCEDVDGEPNDEGGYC